MLEPWVTAVLDQCHERTIPFFFKQWGGIHKKTAGRTLRGRTFDEMPTRSRHALPDATARRELQEHIDSLAQPFCMRHVATTPSLQRATL
jgi:hypothetical protein